DENKPKVPDWRLYALKVEAPDPSRLPVTFPEHPE
ncbi:tail fiber assembly protein, partial [Escherichia coli]|nr:tail fiber assembly protein [Escherichia coli]